MKKSLTTLTGVLVSAALYLPSAMAGTSTEQHLQNIVANTHLNPTVVSMALKAYVYANEHAQVVNKNVLTIVDFSKPSDTPRLTVINLNTDKAIMNLYVAHGSGSGHDSMATRFGNGNGSEESSLGVYVTKELYSGKHGTSLRVAGLEAGINDHVYQRSVVVHGAPYVSEAVAHQYHRVGNSWGCFAVDQQKVGQLISTIKGSSVIFAYAPQETRDRNLANIQI